MASDNAHPKLDAIDRQIIAILEDNARISNKTLAGLIHLSESACLERVRRLERNGVILGYQAVVSVPGKGATVEVLADISLSGLPLSTRDRLSEIISNCEAIVEAYSITGAFSCMLHVVSANLDAWQNLCTQLNAIGIGADKIRYGVVQQRTVYNRSKAAQAQSSNAK